ncbi:glycosyltransferase family 2 protein [Ureibacillus aquaedulcis]|uniref:Glycosyltransferase family 2 protein n=1 Tax=Ureibacillus aquaedulcis TaxID=3058421 RepID=A0ABT8GUT6_9BACL|nr:glycosyltransferase family 2 protein [Ureibacillus sp. BA0131]MDN4495139.1 glycosyltransferase family 2 protein [Ureibacillus sp. BA0131]
MGKKVSVIIPIYNAEQYLQKCIDSVISQTYKNIELVLVNDGSIDNSLSICRRNSQINDNIIVVDSPNKGVSNARNIGIERATGTYIMFVDADDELDLLAIDKLVSIIEKEETDLVICGYNKCNTNKISIEQIAINDQRLTNKDIILKFWDFFNAGIMNAPWNKLYKLSIIKENKILYPTRIRMGEDGYFNVNYLENCNDVFITKDCLYNYYENPSQSSKNVFNNYFEMMMENFDNIEEMFKKIDALSHSKVKEQHNLEIFNVVKHSIDHVVMNKSLTIKDKKNKINTIFCHIRIKEILKYIRVNGIQNRVFLVLFRFKMYYTIIYIRKMLLTGVIKK